MSKWDPSRIFDVVNAAIGQTSQNPKILIPDLVKLVVSYLGSISYVGTVFTQDEWQTFCGRVDPAPALPDNIENIWLSQCPVFRGKKVYETHMLVYIPTTVDNKPLTLKNLEKITPYSTRFNISSDPIFEIYERGDSIEKSCWVLMIKYVLPNSRNERYVVQQSMVSELAKRALATYELPKILEAAVCFVLQSFHDRATENPFRFSSVIYTSCQEKVEDYFKDSHSVIVGKSYDSLYIDRDDSSNHRGVVALRRF